MKDNDDLKRENKNYKKIIQCLVDYVNDVNSYLGKGELVRFKEISQKIKRKKIR